MVVKRTGETFGFQVDRREGTVDFEGTGDPFQFLFQFLKENSRAIEEYSQQTQTDSSNFYDYTDETPDFAVRGSTHTLYFPSHGGGLWYTKSSESNPSNWSPAEN